MQQVESASPLDITTYLVADILSHSLGFPQFTTNGQQVCCNLRHLCLPLRVGKRDDLAIDRAQLGRGPRQQLSLILADSGGRRKKRRKAVDNC